MVWSERSNDVDHKRNHILRVGLKFFFVKVSFKVVEKNYCSFHAIMKPMFVST